MSEGAVRTLPGLRPWQPGETGNPGGRPRKTPDERRAEQFLRERSPKYARQLDRMIFDPDTSESGVLRALELAMAYGLGKPAVRDGDGLAGFTLIVQACPPSQGPIPGVLRSPIASHVAAPAPRVPERLTTIEAAP